MSKKVIALLLAFCTVLSLFSAMASAKAAAETVVSEEASSLSKLSDVFSAGLYVRANAEAGLAADVQVDLTQLLSDGTLYLPGGADPSKLFFSWEDPTLTVRQGGTVCTSGSAPIAKAGEKISYTVSKGPLAAVLTIETMVGAADVEPMFINIDESLGSIAAMKLDLRHETSCFGSILFDGKTYPYASMKGRGNSTWYYVKKPYNLTFYEDSTFDGKKKAELIPGVNSKKWTLLANYIDSSNLRNKTALDLATELNIGLDARFVDVWLNGEYIGLYLLTPKNDYQASKNGYVLENDNYDSEDDPQFAIDGMKEIGILGGYYNRITVKDIGDKAAEAGETAETIEVWFNKAWAALCDEDSQEYRKYFDVDSWAAMYLMVEFAKVYDSYSGSLLMHRDGLTGNDKLYAGPAWDYDNCYGRLMYKALSGVSVTTQLSAQGWFIDSIGYAADTQPVSILQEFGRHDDFMLRVAELYNEHRAYFEGTTERIRADAASIADSAHMNADRYSTFDIVRSLQYSIAVPVTVGTGKYRLHYQVTDSWEAYVNNLCEFVDKRVMFLSDHLDPAVCKMVTTSVPLSEGKLELLIGGASQGKYIFTRSGTGWTIRTENGSYLSVAGGALTYGAKPFVWSYAAGHFWAIADNASSKLTKKLGVTSRAVYYLTGTGASLSVSKVSGSPVSFQKEKFNLPR